MVLFISHKLDEDSISKYDKLIKESKCDVVWASEIELPNNINSYRFSYDTIMELGYKPLKNGTFFHNINFITSRFFKDYPEYSYYWTVEYDIVFTGNWNTIISNYDSDLVSSHIEKFEKGKNDRWDWWKVGNIEIPLENRWKSFNPIFGLSKDALLFLDEFQKRDNCCHYELMMASALANNGFTLRDLSDYYENGLGINSGTVRWRPNYKVEELILENCLYHPVK